MGVHNHLVGGILCLQSKDALFFTIVDAHHTPSFEKYRFITQSETPQSQNSQGPAHIHPN